MFMNLTVISLSMRMDSTVRHTDGSPKRSGHSIVMDVQPQDRNYLELETGEIFCNPNYLQSHGKDRKPISATLFISKAITEKDYEESCMDYYDEYRSNSDYIPSSIYFYCLLPPQEFDDLLADIRSGHIPLSVQITLDDKGSDGALRYVLGSDGKKWNNNDKATGKRRIGIDDLRLSYEGSSLSVVGEIKH